VRRVAIAFLFAWARVAGAQTLSNQPYSWSNSLNAVPAPVTPSVTTPQPATVVPNTWAPADPYAPPPPAAPTAPFKPIIPATTHDVMSPALRRPSVTTPNTVAGVAQPKALPATSTAAGALAGATAERLTRVYYVDRGGSDANTGGYGQALRSLQRGADLAQPGDTVVVNDGVYEGFRAVRSGTRTAPITFRAAGLSAEIVAPAGQSSKDNVSIENVDFVVFEGFKVHGAPRAGIAVIKARGVIVRNCVVGPNQKWGIFTGFTPEVQILDCKAFGSAGEHGIYVSNSGVPDDNPVLRGNECFNNAMNGLQINGDCGAGGDGVIAGALIENNVVHGNGLKGLSLISMQNSVVQNNLIYENGRGGGAGGIHLSDQPDCKKPSDGNTIVNNTIVEPRITGLRIGNNSQNNIVFNNLIVSPEPIQDDGGNQVDAASNMTNESAAGVFANTATGNYRPAAASRAHGSGRSEFAGRTAPRRDMAGQLRAFSAVSVGAYD